MNPYELALYIHLGGLGFSVLSIVYADHLGFAWIRGKVEIIDPIKLKRAHHAVWIALILMITSGLFMFWPAKEALLSQPVFMLKMFFVVCLFINGLFVGKLMNVAAEKPFSALSTAEKVPLFISGAISTGSWIGAWISAVVFFG